MNQDNQNQDLTNEKEEIDFSELLVEAVTGHAVSDFQEEKLPEIKKKCEEIFTNFLVQRAEEKWDKKKAIRIREYSYGGNVPDPEIEAKFMELTDEFIQRTTENNQHTRFSP